MDLGRNQTCLSSRMIVRPMSFKFFIHVGLASTLHKAHDAEKKTDRPRFWFLRILLYDRNQWSGVVFQLLVAIRTLIRIQEIAEFNATMGTFVIHHCYLVKFVLFRRSVTMELAGHKFIQPISFTIVMAINANLVIPRQQGLPSVFRRQFDCLARKIDEHFPFIPTQTLNPLR